MSWRSGVAGSIRWKARSSWDDPPPIPGDSIPLLFRQGHLLNPSSILAGGSASADQAYLSKRQFRAFGPRRFSNLLEGDVSFAAWDAMESRLVLCADRMGCHPIYYCFNDSDLFVSWGVEDLLQYCPDPAFNRTSLAAHLSGFLLPADETFYKRIKRVPPGVVATLDAGGLELESYWTPGKVRPLKLSGQPEYCDALRGHLGAVRRDWLGTLTGPAGIALSSGLDSTSVAASFREGDPGLSKRAFSWVHPTLPEADESEGVEQVCKRLGLKLERIEADRFWTLCGPAGLTSPRAGPEVHYYAEGWKETFGRAAYLGHRYLLSGVGGDELFGSISSYPDLLLSGRWTSLAAQLARGRKHAGFGPRYLFRTVLDPLLRNRFAAWDWRRCRLPAWLTDRTRETARQFLQPPLSAGRGDFGRQLRIRWLGNLARNTQVMRVSSLGLDSGVEMIHPFLDRRVVEFAAALTAEHTYEAGTDKMILRRAFKNSLPLATTDRKKKITVEALFHRGFRERETEKVWPLLREMRASEIGLIDEAPLREQYRRYLEEGTAGQGIWHAICVEDWLRRYF